MVYMWVRIPLVAYFFQLNSFLMFSLFVFVRYHCLFPYDIPILEILITVSVGHSLSLKKEYHLERKYAKPSKVNGMILVDFENSWTVTFSKMAKIQSF